MLGPIVEVQPVDIVHKGLGRSVLGENQRMIVEFDMIIGEALRYVGSRTIDTPFTSAPA